MDPLTGDMCQWVFVGQGPAEIRGVDRYRLVAYASFPSGKQLAYRWVVYKGGQLGTWKKQTLLAAVQKMESGNVLAAQPQIAAMPIKKKSSAKSGEKATSVATKKSSSASKPKLKITIRELW